MFALFYYNVLNAIGLPLPNGFSFYIIEADPITSILCYMGVAFARNEKFFLRIEGLQERALATFVMFF
jgi:hypothetical protein